MKKTRYENLTGCKYGKLTVMGLDHIGKNGHAYWLCQCECGNRKIVRASHLKDGHVKTCGCIPPKKTHGDANQRLYHIWCNMRMRCTNEKDPGFHLYGGRGITVCDEWKTYLSFKNWALANGYSDDLSIDRIDVNGNYEPSNCRWATAREQANNTRKTRFLTYNGETHSVSEWARRLGMNQSTLNMRLNKYMWRVDEALGKEVRKHVS